jgi:prepilin-type N-terminal cleavage/methylation domain-containing protein
MKQGFTLIELLVVIAIIGLLVAISLPSLASSRRAAGAVVCQTRLKQVMTGAINYSVESKDYMPFANSNTMERTDLGPPIWPGPGWLYQFPNKTEADHLKEGLLWRYLGIMDMYRCPMDQDASNRPGVRAMTSYIMNNAMHGPFKLIPNGRVFQYRSDAIVFWEINDQSSFNDASNYNDGNNEPKQLITGRHQGTGNYSAIDTSVRRVTVLPRDRARPAPAGGAAVVFPGSDGCRHALIGR